MRIAARLYLKRRKRDARLTLMADPVDAGDPAPPSDRAANLDLDRALAQLSAPERLCVTLCHGAGLTGEEIAAQLGLPLGTVKSHITRGLQKLRRLMTSEENAHG
jgi:RNA polymerase sigma-70 factor (ECF subfamily)